MNGLLIVLVVLMIMCIIMLVAMMISIVKLTRQIRQTQQKVEAMSRRISGFDGFMSAASVGMSLARSLMSKNGFLAKYFSKKKAKNGRKTKQKTAE